MVSEIPSYMTGHTRLKLRTVRRKNVPRAEKISRMSAGKRTVQLPARKKRGVSEQKKVEKPRTHTPAMRRMSGLREDRATRRKRRAGC